MNEKKLKNAAERITMPDELRQRINSTCETLEQSAKTDNSGGFTDHVYTVERVKPNYILRTVSAVAACAVVVGGIGAATHLMHGQKSPDTVSTDMSEQINTDASPFGDMTRYDLTFGTPASECVPEGEQKSAIAELINNYNWGNGSVAPDNESYRTDFYYAFYWSDGENDAYLQIFDDNTARYVRTAVENREEYQYKSTYATISTNVETLVNKHFSIDSQELISAIDEIMMSGNSPFGDFSAYDMDIQYGEAYGVDGLAGWQKHAIGYYFDSLDWAAVAPPTNENLTELPVKIAYKFVSDDNIIDVLDNNRLKYDTLIRDEDGGAPDYYQTVYYQIDSNEVISTLDLIITGAGTTVFGDFNTLPYGYVDGYLDNSESIMEIQYGDLVSTINVYPTTALTAKQQAILTDYFFNRDIHEWTSDDTDELLPLMSDDNRYDRSLWVGFQYLGENELRTITIAPWGQLQYIVINYEEKDGKYVGELVECTAYRIDYDAFKAAYDLAFSDDEPTDDTSVEPTTTVGDNTETSEEPFYMLYKELVYNSAPIYTYGNNITSPDDADLPHKTELSNSEADAIMYIFEQYRQYITETHDTPNSNDVMFRFSVDLEGDNERFLDVYSNSCVSWYDVIDGKDTNVHSYMYTSPQPICEALQELYDKISYANICRAYIEENDHESATTITNWDSPTVDYVKSLPNDYYYISESSDKSDRYVRVEFNTDQDAVLGPITLYLEEGGAILGMDWRE